MKKKVLLLLVIMVSLVMVTGCGGAMKKAAGTYKLVYSKFVGDPDTAKREEEWTIELNEDGTGKSNRDNSSYTVEWSIDGENIKITEKFLALTIDYNGTLKDGKLDVFNGDKTNDLTLEAVFNKQ